MDKPRKSIIAENFERKETKLTQPENTNQRITKTILAFRSSDQKTAITNVGEDRKAETPKESVHAPFTSSNEERQQYQSKKVPLQGIEKTNDNLVLKKASEYTGEGECSECLDATTPCQKMKKMKEPKPAAEIMKIQKLDHVRVQKLFIDDGAVFKSVPSNTSVKREQNVLRKKSTDSIYSPESEKSKRLEGLLGEMVKRTVEKHLDGRDSSKKPNLFEESFDDSDAVEEKYKPRLGIDSSELQMRGKPFVSTMKGNEILNCNHCDKSKKKTELKDELVYIKMSTPGLEVIPGEARKQSGTHPPVGSTVRNESSLQKSPAIMDLVTDDTAKLPQSNKYTVKYPNSGVETHGKMKPEQKPGSKVASPGRHRELSDAFMPLFKTYLSMADSSMRRSNRRFVSPLYNDRIRNESYLIYSNKRKGSSINAHNRKSNVSLGRNSLMRHENPTTDCARRKKQHAPSHHRQTELGRGHYKRSTDSDRRVTFNNNKSGPQRMSKKCPSRANGIPGPAAARSKRLSEQPRTSVHRESNHQYPGQNRVKDRGSRSADVGRPRIVPRDSLQFGRGNNNYVARSSTRAQKYPRQRADEPAREGRAHRPSMVSTVIKKKSSNLHRPMMTTANYPGVRDSASVAFEFMKKNKRGNTNSQNPFQKHHRYITDAPSNTDIYGNLNVKDFIEFLSSISRNTISSLSNKRKALKLYRNYLFGPRR